MAELFGEEWLRKKGEELAEYVLDSYGMKGKTIREWAEEISKRQPVRPYYFRNYVPLHCGACDKPLDTTDMAYYCPYCGAEVDYSEGPEKREA